jgi:hypothetical protein
LPLLFLGREIARQRDDGGEDIYTHDHLHTATPNNESSSVESSNDGTATPPTGPNSPCPSWRWRNSTAKAITIKALKDEASDRCGAFGSKHWKEVNLRNYCSFRTTNTLSCHS